MTVPTYTLPPMPTGGKPQANSASLHFHVRGHASSRWRGSKDSQASIKLNQALSERRAASVRAAIEQQLKVRLGSLPFTVSSKGDGIWTAPEQFKPDDNEPITRSVSVSVYLTTKSSQVMTVKNPPKRIQARTRHWYVSINDFQLTALFYAQASGRLYIRNAVSGKRQLYTFSLNGGGAMVDPVGWLKRGYRAVAGNSRVPANRVVGEEVHFETSTDMGFADFDSQWIELASEQVKWLVGAQSWDLSFRSLGPRAQGLVFKTAVQAGMPAVDVKGGGVGVPLPMVGVARVVGSLAISGPREDDFLEEPVKDSEVIGVFARDFGGGVVAMFPTGKSGYHDIPANERQQLEDFVMKWAGLYDTASRL